MTTIFNSPEELAAAKAAAEFSDYRQQRDAEVRQRELENNLTAAMNRHRDAVRTAQEETDTAVGSASVKIAKAIVEFRDALAVINFGEEEARKAALAAHAELYPGAKRAGIDLFGGKEHARPTAAGHTVARILARIQNEHDIHEPQKHWSQI